MKKQTKIAIGTAFAGAFLLGGALTVGASQTQADSQQPTATAIYRLYNLNTGEHFYTASPGEAKALQAKAWRYEGTAWIAPLTGTPVYRLFNPNAKGGDHYYTTSLAEGNALIKKGWRADNGGKPVFYSSTGKQVPVYVAFNPKASSGSHNYTTSSAETNSLTAQGWKYPSVAWYAVQAGQPYSAPKAPVISNISAVKSVSLTAMKNYLNNQIFKGFDSVNVSLNSLYYVPTGADNTKPFNLMAIYKVDATTTDAQGTKAANGYIVQLTQGLKITKGVVDTTLIAKSGGLPESPSSKNLGFFKTPAEAVSAIQSFFSSTASKINQ